jgi:hypothetical protein
MKKFLQPIIIATLCILSAASAWAQTQVRVAGFKPSVSGFRFTNSFPSIPYTINVAGINMPIGDASNGMCGGMVYAVRDYFEAGYLTPPPNATPPTGGPLYTHLSHRLFDSFNLPGGPLTYLNLMNPDLPDHETWLSNAGLAPHGRAWVMIVQEWPKIQADLDQGRLSPMALIRVKDHDPFKMGLNHQVLAYGYTLNGNDLVINVYDPNYPGNDNVTISLNIGDPQHTTDVYYSTGETMYCFFQPGYTYVEPPAPYPSAAKLTGDFNGDGKTDVALTGPAGWNTLPVAFSNGNGSFNVTNTFIGDFAAFAANRQAAPLTGDFNGDGKTDIALTGPAGWNTLPIAFSNGDGSFTVTNTYIGDFAAWSSRRDVSRLTGDFNGDGRTDIALIGPKGWGTMPVAFSNGDGSFTVTNYGINGFASFAADVNSTKLTGDFNGDGRTDVALTGPSYWNTLPVAFSNGNGTFSVTNLYIGGFAGWASDPMAKKLVGDFNGDGKTDVALTGPTYWASVPVAFSNGNGTFLVTNIGNQYFASLASDPDAKALTGDFNGDGKTDIALTGPAGWSDLPVAFSNGNGSFATVSLPTSQFPAWASNPYTTKLLGDFNGDGKTDIGLTGVLGWGSLPVAFSNGNGSYFVTNYSILNFASWAAESPL